MCRCTSTSIKCRISCLLLSQRSSPLKYVPSHLYRCVSCCSSTLTSHSCRTSAAPRAPWTLHINSASSIPSAGCNRANSWFGRRNPALCRSNTGRLFSPTLRALFNTSFLWRFLVLISGRRCVVVQSMAHNFVKQLAVWI